MAENEEEVKKQISGEKYLEVALYGLYTAHIMGKYGGNFRKFFAKSWIKGSRLFGKVKWQKIVRTQRPYLGRFIKRVSSRIGKNVMASFKGLKNVMAKFYTAHFKNPKNAKKVTTALKKSATKKTGRGRVLRVGKTVARKSLKVLDVALWAWWGYELLSGGSDYDEWEDDDEANIDEMMAQLSTHEGFSPISEDLLESIAKEGDNFRVDANCANEITSSMEIAMNKGQFDPESAKNFIGMLNIASDLSDDQETSKKLGLAMILTGCRMYKSMEGYIKPTQFWTGKVDEEGVESMCLDDIYSYILCMTSEVLSDCGDVDGSESIAEEMENDFDGASIKALAGMAVTDLSDPRLN